MKTQFDLIREWGIEKGIIEKSNPLKQLGKLDEERLELFNALLDNDQEEVEDAIGDCVVVLTLLAKMRGLNIEDCIESAYNVISKRTGKMENGTFVKDK